MTTAAAVYCRQSITELLTSVGARPDDFWPDCWALDGRVLRLVEMGADTWQLEFYF